MAISERAYNLRLIIDGKEYSTLASVPEHGFGDAIAALYGVGAHYVEAISLVDGCEHWIPVEIAKKAIIKFMPHFKIDKL